MKLPFYIVDVFAEKKYTGNQLAVFLDAEALSTEEMQKIAREINFAESTFITKIQPEKNSAAIRIFTVEYEMKFAGHPIIGTSWVLMNKIVESQPRNFNLSVPIGEIPIQQTEDLVWLQAAQPEFLDVFSKEEFLSFNNLSNDDFDDKLPIQEVTTGSAFVIVPLKNIKALKDLNLELIKTKEWLLANCKTNHRALYFYCFDNGKLISRMLYIENNQIMEDAATGSASTCLQAFLLKYHSPEIKTINHQGDFINRSSQIYFDGKLSENHFDIKIGGKTQFIAKGEWEV
ncbi:PhzF family phenazine biosynthesis protein [Flavobacterium aestivum]|uniref:PhzF family phenazine biosynthesis protein n=1 Tax=Flavobacterium aestivum TaxID=3003257 RepID=UPI002286C67F|nr:PhzF family phenazine biosynthesis protein [Flavobacterium aestivum]